jgi:hypothetical protein
MAGNHRAEYKQRHPQTNSRPTKLNNEEENEPEGGGGGGGGLKLKYLARVVGASNDFRRHVIRSADIIVQWT